MQDAIDLAVAQTESLFEEYLGRYRASPLPLLAPPAALAEPYAHAAEHAEEPIDEDSDDEDYRRTFSDHTTIANPDRLKQQQQASELQRFMDDDLDTSLTTYGDDVPSSYSNEPLRWWRERGASKYSILASMAYDLFSIPGMSSECERAFSAAKRMITHERYNLKHDVIEADQCLKSWFKSGITNGHAALTNLPDDDDEEAAATDDPHAAEVMFTTEA